MVSVRMDRGDVRKAEAALAGIKNGYKLALVKALNHTAKQLRREAVNEIHRDVKLGKRYITDKLKVRTARYSRLEARVGTPSRGLQLARYGARALKRGGVSVEVKRGQRKRLPGAFLVTYRNGVKAVYVRTGPGKWGTFEGAEQRYGPSVSQVYRAEHDELAPPARNRLMERLAYETDELLRRQKKGAL